MSQRDYIDSCQTALGPKPTIDCDEGIDLESTGFVDTADQSLVTKPSLGYGCVDPSLIGYKPSCNPPARLSFYPGTAPNRQSVLWAALCRRIKKDSNEVGLIGHNTETGQTCFFVANAEISPNSKSLAVKGLDSNFPEKGWKHMSEITYEGTTQCVTCHNNSPWIKSLFVENGVNRYLKRGADGQNQTKLKSLTEIFRAKPKAYTIVKEAALNDFPVNFKRSFGAWTPTKLMGPSVKYCTRCHQMGGNDKSLIIAKRSVAGPWGIGPAELNESTWSQYIQGNIHWKSNLAADSSARSIAKPRNYHEFQQSEFYRGLYTFDKCKNPEIKQNNICWQERADRN